MPVSACGPANGMERIGIKTAIFSANIFAAIVYTDCPGDRNKAGAKTRGHVVAVIQ
jgi:hypothetical protein